MAGNFDDNTSSFVGLAKRQLQRLSERTVFLAPVANIADISWRILLLLYTSGNVQGGIPAAWEKELNMSAHTLRRYLEMLRRHHFITIGGNERQPIDAITLLPNKKHIMDELLSQTAQSGELFPDSSDFG